MCLEDAEVITVGSSAYNLAGDISSRGNFLKNNILSMIFSGVSKSGLGKGIVDAHIAGPATSYTSFYRWAETSGYNTQVGNLGGLVYSSGSISSEGFEFLVPVKTTHDQRAITFSITALDLHLIALEWIINNTPENRNLDFVATLEKIGLVFTGKVLITYTLGSTVTFTPSYNLNNNMPFVYLYHEERLKVSQVVTDTGWITAAPPAKVGFTGSPTTDAQNIVQNKTTITVKTYSDSTPTSTVVSTAAQNLAFNKVTAEYTKVTTIVATPTVKGVVTTLVQSEESFYDVLFTESTSSSSEVIGGITVTTTITESIPSLTVYWKYKQVSTAVTTEKWLPYLLKIYQKGSSSIGDVLLFGSPTAIQRFFPVIPLRRDNVMVDLANFPTQYGWNRKAAKKCFGAKNKYNSLIDSLADNPSLTDIDHAWVVFGVSLSTKQQDGQKYLYEFFKNLADTTISALDTYKSPIGYANAWAAFVDATTVSTNDEIEGVARPIPPLAQEYTVTVNASAAVQDWLYNTTITAKGGGQVVGSGYHVKALGKIGHAWVYAKSSITLSVPEYNNDGDLIYTPSTATVIAFGKQVTADNWVEYEFFDLIHVNNVYQGITATTLGTTVIASTEENSSFIVPLHEAVFTELTLVRRTQLSLECSFLVVNYYDKQTIPWYSSRFFQIIIAIVIIVIAVYTGYIGPESAGLFGTNAAVGATLGFAGTAAIVAGAIANAVAAAIVSALITKVAVSALGEEIGKIVGFIASMVAIDMMNSGDKAFNLADSWAQMTKADNLIKMTMSGMSEYGNRLQSQAMEINAQTQALMVESNQHLKDIARLTQELAGDTGVDPTSITNALRYATENPAQFFNRTTMTGTEIAEISIKLVEDFPAPQLALPYLD
jgi:hypothetical protein